MLSLAWITHLRVLARVLVVGLVAPSACAATGACAIADFQTVEIRSAHADGWPLNVNNQLRLRYPHEPNGAALAADNFLRVTFADGAMAVISLRDATELARNAPAGSAPLPAPYWRNVFTGADEEGCKVADVLDLTGQDYRIQFDRKGFHVYAFGKGDHHQFFAIPQNPNHPVVNGLFRRMTRARAESILETITTEGI